MTTTIVHTIKPAGGGHYSSLNSWEAAQRRNLTAVDEIEAAEVYSGGNAVGSLFFIDGSAGWVTDSTRYVEIRAAAGHEHSGTWDTNKAYCYSTADRVFIVFAVDFHMNKMQCRTHTSSGTSGCLDIVTRERSVVCNIDRCLILNTGTASSLQCVNFHNPYNSNTLNTTVMNSIVLDYNSNCAVEVQDPPVTVNLYNCTIRGFRAITQANSAVVNTQNCYLSGSASICYNGTINKGANDATSNTEAVTSNLRSIPYSTATFFNVTTGGGENLRLVVSAGNKLINNGANLTGSGVTTDIIGTARPQAGAFDIGAFENDVPICWNYTARYKDSNKLFKASGCGNYPKSLRVPSNIDKATGRMIDDGVEIDPSEYQII